MTRKRVFAWTAITVLLAGFGTVAPAAQAAAPTPTTAAAAPRDCAPDLVCFYTEPNYRGRRFDYHDPQWHTCHLVETIQPGHIKATRSVWNNDDQGWTFYNSSGGCWGNNENWTVRPGRGQANMEAYFWN
ncbi:peptidase inhibitor family I36 protein [Streptomyces sp. Je 1-369]|uniref:peptidase inhibitor family I36 protein n=1 Tax=Streptomyces sp. Je 1-369 TaxID=2966192 RepID=UPI002285CC4C|nr:peptidase inhibitor family I36 protein [Streptomyces sp. Je 1-369]WAL99095.1 peptidase inhibitor family I36 protein [Streptomyces sp. Je 1-369]